MKKLAVAALLFVSLSCFAHPYAGVWRSTDTTGGASPGTMTLEKSGKASLAPDGFAAVHGSYTVSGTMITLTMDRLGTSVVDVALMDLGQKLLARYSSGTHQLFTKQDHK